MSGGAFSAEELKARIGDPTSPGAGRRGVVAVLPLRGVIAHRMGGMTEMSGGMSTEKFAAMFREALKDDSIGAIVIDVDSPGGTIAGVTELAAEIYAARGIKPIVAEANALMASAAMWIAASAEQIVATPSAMIGAIGVITSHLDTSKAEEQEGVTRTVISAGKFKSEGYGPLTEEAKAAVQARVDEAYGVMVKDIARGRGVKASDVRDGFGEGRVVSASQAKALGMIDKIATIETTVTRLLGAKSPRAALSADWDATELVVEDDPLALTAASFESDLRRRIEGF